MTDNERLRFSARDAVLFNPLLSHGAVRLYLALDQYAGFSGKAWPLQFTLGARIGADDRTIRRWLMELRQHVTVVKRQQAASFYLLEWLPTRKKPIPDRTQMSGLEFQTGQNEHPDRTQASGLILIDNQALNQAPVTCEKCQDLGFVADDNRSCDCEKGREVLYRRLHPRIRKAGGACA